MTAILLPSQTSCRCHGLLTARQSSSAHSGDLSKGSTPHHSQHLLKSNRCAGVFFDSPPAGSSSWRGSMLTSSPLHCTVLSQATFGQTHTVSTPSPPHPQHHHPRPPPNGCASRTPLQSPAAYVWKRCLRCGKCFRPSSTTASVTAGCSHTLKGMLCMTVQLTAV